MKTHERFTGIYRGPEASAQQRKEAAENRMRLAHAVELGVKAVAAAQKRAARSKAKGPQAATPSGSVLARYSVLKGAARTAFYSVNSAAIWAERAKAKATLSR